jgi:hypothetical protein
MIENDNLGLEDGRFIMNKRNCPHILPLSIYFIFFPLADLTSNPTARRVLWTVKNIHRGPDSILSLPRIQQRKMSIKRYVRPVITGTGVVGLFLGCNWLGSYMKEARERQLDSSVCSVLC